MLLVASVASAAITYTVVVSKYREVWLQVSPVGECTTATPNCVFMITVSGVPMTSDGQDRTPFSLALLSDDPMFTAAQIDRLKTIYLRSRRAWKSAAINEDTE